MSDDVEPSPGDLLYVEVDHEAANIVLIGEFDMTGSAPFWAAVSEALATNPPSLTLETRGVTFIDSWGLAALIRAREAADEAGVAFRVSEPSPPLQRIVEITGTVELLSGE